MASENFPSPITAAEQNANLASIQAAARSEELAEPVSAEVQQANFAGVEAAAVREPQADPVVSTESLAVAPAVQEPLTPQDIAQLTRSRGRPPTEEEIKYMNAARVSGKHLTIV